MVLRLVFPMTESYIYEYANKQIEWLQEPTVPTLFL